MRGKIPKLVHDGLDLGGKDARKIPELIHDGLDLGGKDGRKKSKRGGNYDRVRISEQVVKARGGSGQGGMGGPDGGDLLHHHLLHRSHRRSYSPVILGWTSCRASAFSTRPPPLLRVQRQERPPLRQTNEPPHNPEQTPGGSMARPI